MSTVIEDDKKWNPNILRLSIPAYVICSHNDAHLSFL